MHQNPGYRPISPRIPVSRYMDLLRKWGFPRRFMYPGIHGTSAERGFPRRTHVLCMGFMCTRTWICCGNPYFPEDPCIAIHGSPGENRAIAGILVQIGLRNRQKRGFFNFLGVRPIKIGFPGGKSTQNWGDFALRRVSQGINALWPVGTRGKTGPGLRKL